MTKVAAHPTIALLTKREVCGAIAVSPRTLQRMVGSGEFPLPIEVRPGTPRWELCAVEAWLEERKKSARSSSVPVRLRRAI